MPVRSSGSSVLRWPDRAAVEAAVRAFARAATARPLVRRVGWFGSYARGDAGVGSDLDLVVVVEASDLPFERRGTAWDTTALPVPADLLVYTEAEWARLAAEDRPPRLVRETVWIEDGKGRGAPRHAPR
jgi:hypothetical protein